MAPKIRLSILQEEVLSALVWYASPKLTNVDLEVRAEALSEALADLEALGFIRALSSPDRTRRYVVSDAARTSVLEKMTLVMFGPLGAVHALSSAYSGERTLCMRDLPSAKKLARFERATFDDLKSAGWRICGECRQLVRAPGRPAAIARAEEAPESYEALPRRSGAISPGPNGRLAPLKSSR